MRGEKQHLGTQVRTSNGYTMVKLGIGHPYANSVGWQYQHRLNMMAHLGRPLRAGERVTHIDGDRSNNEIGNLRLVTR